MKPRPSIALLPLLALIASLGSSAMTALAAEDVYDERTMEIARNLACPVCEGQSVADSNSRVALEMRDEIQAQVDAGRTDEEIYDYFRARYDDEVLLDPPREGINLALWWVPVIVVLLGLGVVALYLRDSARLSRRSTPAAAVSSHDAELEEIADLVLHDGRGSPTLPSGDRPAESS